MRIYFMHILSVSLLVRQKCKNIETWFSRRLSKIEVWLFFVKSCLIDAHLFYEYIVGRSGYKRQKYKNSEMWFSRRLSKIEVWFYLIKFHLVNEHLFINIFSVYLSGKTWHECKNILNVQRFHDFCPTMIYFLLLTFCFLRN